MSGANVCAVGDKFRCLFLGQIKEQLSESLVALSVPSGLPSLWDKRSRSLTDSIIFCLTLDYPFKFSCCLVDDFRTMYLNARTDTEVEVFGFGPDNTSDKPWTPYKTYIPLNKCVPLFVTELGIWRSGLDVQKQAKESFITFKSFYTNIVNQYLDYLIACVLKQSLIPEEFKGAVEEHYKLFPNYVAKPFPKRIPKIYSEHFLDYYRNDTIAHPYFVTTWDEKEGFQDKWMFFGDLLKEAEKIKNGSHPCSDYLLQYPELTKMLDIDELWIYNVWHHYISWSTFAFLEKNWYRAQNNNDYNLKEFQGDNYRIKTSEELIASELESEPPKNLFNDGFDGESMTTYAERQEMHINYLKYVSDIPKTVWGYKNEPCPISDIWFKMHSYTK